jgi:cytochrome P450
MRADPSAEWEFREWDGKPVLFMPDMTAMVHCKVTAFGKAKAVFLPVMDHRNKAIVSPDAFAINTAMQRALVKAIALHGLGLYIYAGEDLPAVEQEKVEEEDKTLTTAAELEARKGTQSFRAYYKTLSKDDRHKLEGRMDGLKALAQTADIAGFTAEMDKEEARA